MIAPKPTPPGESLYDTLLRERRAHTKRLAQAVVLLREAGFVEQSDGTWEPA